MNSYWINSEKNKEKYNKVEKNIETDICIIGGGITGISTAYYLTKENLKERINGEKKWKRLKTLITWRRF